MQQLLQLLQRSAAKTIAFRAEIWLWLILESLPLYILLLVWRSLYTSPSQTLGGMELNTVLLYYLLVFFLDMATAAHFESWRIDEIRQGKIDYYLCKPLGYLKELFTRHLGDKLISFMLKFPLFILFIGLVQLTFHISFPDITSIQLLQFIGFLAGAFVLQFSISTIIVLLGFWLENALGLDHFRWLTVSLLSGVAIPFTYMPQWLRSLALMSPFKFLHGVPVLTLLGEYTVSFTDYIYLIVTCVLCIAGISLMWSITKKRYAAYGG